MNKSIGFIGGGRITNIILQAFVNKSIGQNSLYVYEIDLNVSQKLKDKYPDITLTEMNKVAEKDIIFIALHPPVIKEILDKIADIVSEDSIIISLAPKIKAEFISDKLNNKNIVRMIPNATSVINQGINPIFFSDECHSKKELYDLLSKLGYTFETEESKLEAYAIISAMLPTYFWFQYNEMIDIGKQIGLSETESTIAVKKTLQATLDTMFTSTLNKDEVFDLIPVKPIGDHEEEIKEIFRNKLIGLHNKIKP